MCPEHGQGREEDGWNGARIARVDVYVNARQNLQFIAAMIGIRLLHAYALTYGCCLRRHDLVPSIRYQFIRDRS